MPEQDPIEVLMQEHRLIERVLNALEKTLDSSESVPPPVEFLEQAAGFFRNFADACHHFKEEQVLFPELERRGIPREGGPVGVMLTEHELGRALVRTAAERLGEARKGDTAALEEAAGNLRQFIQLLRDHIFKEDNVLFQMARQVLARDELNEVARRFEQAESPENEQYVNWARSLAV